MKKFFVLILTCLTLVSYSYSQGPALGSIAPEITMEDSLGNVKKLSSLRGKIVLIDFWASWCYNCRLTNPDLVEIYHKYHDKGFDIYSVSLDQKKNDWLAAIKEDKLEWPNHVCDYNIWKTQAAKTYDVLGIPMSYLLDETGKIIAIDLSHTKLEKYLKKMFDKSTHVYPKHATNLLKFNTTSKYKIIKASGKKVRKGKAKQVDISKLKKGTYQVVVGKLKEEIEILDKKNINTSVKYTLTEDKLVFDEEAVYDIYNKRGILLATGKAKEIHLKELYLSDKGYNTLVLNGSFYSF